MSSTAKKWFPHKNGVKTFLDDVEKMTPKEKAFLVTKCARTLCNFIGLRFLSDMKIFWLTYAPPTVALLYVLLVIYTVIYNTFHNNFLHGIKATCAIAVAVPVSVAFIYNSILW